MAMVLPAPMGYCLFVDHYYYYFFGIYVSNHMGNSIFGASVSLGMIFGNNRELRRREARRALLVNIAMQQQHVEYASILQGIMNEVSLSFAASPEERSRNATQTAAMHGDHAHTVFAGVDVEPQAAEDEDEMMATRGRSIFYSLWVTAPNHLPRLLREVARLTEDCELLADLTWRDHMSYKEMHGLRRSRTSSAWRRS